MPHADKTGENQTWVARNACELGKEHKHGTRVTAKPLEDSRLQPVAKTEQSSGLGAATRSFVDKLFRRRNTGNPHDREPSREVSYANALPQKSSLPAKPKQPQESSQPTVDREPYTPLGVANPTGPAPPIPPRYDLISHPPDRIRRKSEKESAACRRARERALRHLETDHDIRRFVALRDAPPAQLKPGTWIPGQVNTVNFSREVVPADQRVNSDVDHSGDRTTLELIRSFPKPPRPGPPTYKQPPSTQALKTVPRRHYQNARDIPIPPIPSDSEQSGRDSFLELRRKRSYYV
ncbi:unnamed protein product [Rhizoctonia solani]|uniref:Uncharacterized protein n=1 Tax=Rhizoctonia solani TaxID=456999 RepID=A0A8H2WEV5_9AGAM|nr:unnamed protein product [Rhizoctonia solani]